MMAGQTCVESISEGPDKALVGPTPQPREYSVYGRARHSSCHTHTRRMHRHPPCPCRLCMEGKGEACRRATGGGEEERYARTYVAPPVPGGTRGVGGGGQQPGVSHAVRKRGTLSILRHGMGHRGQRVRGQHAGARVPRRYARWPGGEEHGEVMRCIRVGNMMHGSC